MGGNCSKRSKARHRDVFEVKVYCRVFENYWPPVGVVVAAAVGVVGCFLHAHNRSDLCLIVLASVAVQMLRMSVRGRMITSNKRVNEKSLGMKTEQNQRKSQIPAHLRHQAWTYM